MGVQEKSRKITLYTVLQSIILVVKFFDQNGLLSYASACSFDFLFSVIPILMLIVSVLVRVLHASPEMIESLFEIVPQLKNSIEINSVIEAISSFNFINFFEIFLVVFIVWMARRFFASTFVAMKRVFLTQQKRKVVFNQILAVVFEFIIILAASILIILFFSLKTILTLPVFHGISQLDFIFNGFLAGQFVKFLPNILIFIAITLLYLIASGTKPSLKLCAVSGFLCTFSFWIFRFFLHLFINVNKYNLIYGVLGQFIIMFMDIFFFFVFLLFFAQYIFIFQFFDDLLLGELYLLSKKNISGKAANIYRKIFLSPDFLTAKYKNLVDYKKGRLILEEGTVPECAYYVTSGCAEFINEKTGVRKFLPTGAFFCDVECVLNEPLLNQCKVYSDCQLFCVSRQTLLLLIEKNPLVAQKLLEEKICQSLYDIK